MAFYFGCIFIAAGALYTVNEIRLGEQQLTMQDFEWRFMETLVWSGFFVGMVGYLRTYLVSIERECNDNRDQINAFGRTILLENDLDLDSDHGSEADEGDVLMQGLNPWSLGKESLRNTLSIVGGVAQTAGRVVHSSAHLSAKFTDKAASQVGFIPQLVKELWPVLLLHTKFFLNYSGGSCCADVAIGVL